MHGIGAKIDPDTEFVFHQPEILIASPEQGLKVGRDLRAIFKGFVGLQCGVDGVNGIRQRLDKDGTATGCIGEGYRLTGMV